jgi:hypothetical protein
MSTVVPATDEIFVQRSGTLYRTNIGKLSSTGNFTPTDYILVSRGGTDYYTPAQNFDALRTTDALLVVRMGTAYYVNVSDVRRALTPPVVYPGFTVEINSDVYTREAVADRDISVHTKLRRCVISNAGVVQYYLNADSSGSRMKTSWLRLVETSVISEPYTGAFSTTEVANTKLRAGVLPWASGVTYEVGDRVISNNEVWECRVRGVSNTANSPNYGTGVAASLTTTTTPVMVEIPLFSVSMSSASTFTHTFKITLGEKTNDGFQVHPAFVRANGTYRSHIYVGAYMASGTGGANSNSGVVNVASMSRVTARTAATNRGAGWHLMGFWDWNAIQWLLMTEFQDLNSQRAMGLGPSIAMDYTRTTGQSDSKGNRFHTAYSAVASACVSYRGLENIYGVAWQWMDGINAQGTALYTCNDPTKWADTITADYTYLGEVAVGYTNSSIVALVPNNIGLLPGGTTTTTTSADLKGAIGDGFWTNSDGTLAAGQHGGFSGTYANGGDYYAGTFMKNYFYLASSTYTSQATRIAYYPGG